jgi:hypothetical protein
VLRGNPAYLSSVARDVLADAQEAQRAGRLGFLVGAGLSTAVGLPGWNAFNRSLVEKTFARHGRNAGELAREYLDQLSGQSLAAADFVRRRAGGDFHVVVRGALYERDELQSYAPSEAHHALARLAVESSPPFPCLHTTNYDDLLELALSQVAGRRALPVHASRRLVADGPRVVHLHGYFPFHDPPQAAKARLARELVLSDLDYNRLSNDHAAWTNRELLSLLDARSVLIVGMSLADPNVRRVFAYLSDRRASDGPQHFVVLLERDDDAEAARLVDEDEHEFWRARGVKILRIATWDRLNYLLRRIRFADERWDLRHRQARVAWARAHYAAVDFDDDATQELGAAALGEARDGLVEEAKLGGRVELNLFLPMLDGSLRRALSSMPGRAKEAPRRFVPAHDRAHIPEVDAALTLGQPISRGAIKLPPPHGEPPFQSWYRSLVSVPIFDDAAGGVPVAVMQLCSSEKELPDALEPARLSLVRGYLREAALQTCSLLRSAASSKKPWPNRRT